MAHPERWILMIRNEYDPQAPKVEAHMFATEAEAQDYAEVYILGESYAEMTETEISISKAPPCFEPTAAVVVHKPRGF